MKDYEVIETHYTYLTYKVKANSPEKAQELVENMYWDEANNETTEYKDTEVWETKSGEIVKGHELP